ncbi:GGDEF domain-containing protein [Duganella qianjiadongensis]|uniref:diguanylate cyclase n=1 Tax=Duganella qianjiadongensis TaxID=2692176 RepID=A0ABW9VQ73_9BURK|nr:diguanylate cyclase [Duganella qianjiadongensis]MYM41561.1 diguanylate cyclase [Duganella qianjiadongensis]
MRLTRLFTLISAILALLVCGVQGRSLWSEWRQYQSAERGLQALQLVEASMRAAEKLSFERGPSNAVMGDGYPAAAAKQERLRSARNDTNNALRQLQQQLDQRDATAALDQALREARRNVDQLAAQPPDGRTPAQLNSAVERMYALVPLALDTVTAATHASEQAYPRITRLLVKSRLAVELREYAGRLGSTLTVPLATAQPLTREQQERLQFLRGRLEQLRQLIRMNSSEADQAQAVQAALARMDSDYFARGQQIISAVEQASSSPRASGAQRYGMDTAQFAQRYVPTMAPILAVRDALLQEAQLQAHREFQQARHELGWAMLNGAAILMVLVALLIIVRVRVVAPLLRATRAVVRLGNGDFTAPSRISRRKDEIGDMLRALATLRENSMERQRLEQERAHLIEELKTRADTDYLTGILNRRAFATAGNLRLRGAREKDESLAVILFDIDHFKSVNDCYGHDAGDQVLIRIAEVVRATLRDGEILARYGGEEFVVMPSYCGLEAARALAERLRVAIEQEPLTLSDGYILRVTASFGVAVAHGPHAALDDLFHSADLALYRAKSQGRNRVETQL